MKDGFIAREEEKTVLAVNEEWFHCPRKGKDSSSGQWRTVSLPEKRKKQP